MRKRSGFILIFVMFIIASAVFLVSLVINRVGSYQKLSKSWSDGAKAQALAISGIDIAISQIVDFDLKKLKDSEKKEDSTMPLPLRDSQGKVFGLINYTKKDNLKENYLNFLFKKLNHWQKIELTEKNEGIDGKINIYISSEEGKINLNRLCFVLKDSQKDKKDKNKEISEDERKVCSLIGEKLKPIFQTEKRPLDLNELIKNLSKKYEEGLEDVTMLLTADEKVFTEWQNNIFVQKSQDEKVDGLALTDIFTVSTKSDKITPFLFSQGIKKLLSLKDKKIELSKLSEDFLKAIQEEKIDWSKTWDLADFYSKKYEEIPEEFKELFSENFTPKTFTVTVYGQVGLVKKKICAIIKRVTVEEETLDKKDIDKKEKKDKERFIINKFYWLDN